MRLAFTLKETAGLLKVPHGRVLKLARALNLGRKIGLSWLFNQKEISTFESIVKEGDFYDTTG